MVFKAAKIVQKFNIEGSVNHVQANRFFNINIYIKFVPVHINYIMKREQSFAFCKMFPNAFHFEENKMPSSNFMKPSGLEK